MRILVSLLLLSIKSAGSYQADIRSKAQEATALAQKVKYADYSPDYQKLKNPERPPEIKYNTPETLERGGGRALEGNVHAKHLHQTALSRQYFILDPETDPLYKNSEAAVRDPERFLSEPQYNRVPSTEFETKTCRESKPEGEYRCSRTLQLPGIHIEPAKYSHYWCFAGNHSPDDPRCSAKRYYPIARKYKDEVVSVTKEEWVSTCGALEQKEKQGLCKLVKKVCPKGKETRQIAQDYENEKPEFRAITRPCWRYEHIYACHFPSVNTCAPLRKKSCTQTQSKCIRKVGEECTEWEQTYKCPKGKGGEKKQKLSEKGYVLPKVDTPPSLETNQDMKDALAKLSLFEDIQKEMRQTPTAENIHVFKGGRKNCTIAFGSFKNCCTNGKGWGVSMGLSGCSGEETDLARRKYEGKCVEIGTYCAEKWPIIGCVRKKRSHCCFPTKLARILHEQGRRQIGLSWGSAEAPVCRGFKTHELSKINFDALNLKEVFAEIAARVKQTANTVVKRNITTRIKDMTSSFKNASKTGDF